MAGTRDALQQARQALVQIKELAPSADAIVARLDAAIANLQEAVAEPVAPGAFRTGGLVANARAGRPPQMAPDWRTRPFRYDRTCQQNAALRRAQNKLTSLRC